MLLAVRPFQIWRTEHILDVGLGVGCRVGCRPFAPFGGPRSSVREHCGGHGVAGHQIDVAVVDVTDEGAAATVGGRIATACDLTEGRRVQVQMELPDTS